MMRRILSAAIAAIGLAMGVGSATAATQSVAVSTLNIRAGPGTAYPVVTVVPQGAPVRTLGV